MYLRKHERHFLSPKGRFKELTIPAVPNHIKWSWSHRLIPAERRAMQEIVHRADLIAFGDQSVLVVAVSPRTLDILASFEADLEDREDDLDDEPDEGMENDSDSDNAFDLSQSGFVAYNDEEENSVAPKSAKKSREAMRRKLRRIRKKNGAAWSFRDVPANFDLAGMARRQGGGWF